MRVTSDDAVQRLAVVIPTKNRPEKLARCLSALEQARSASSFDVWVCDSSHGPDDRAAVASVCARWDWVHLRSHDGRNVAEARNFCATVAPAELLVNIDDDVQVEPQAIRRLLEAYEAGRGPRVVGGSVCWDGDWWSRPMRLLPFGFSRRIEPGEQPDFINGAVFLYPRAYALQWPWNSSIRVADDIFMSTVWRGAGVELLWAPEARAVHDHEQNAYGAGDQDSTIYTNLFLSLIAVPNWRRAVGFEVLGFASGLKAFGRDPSHLRRFLTAWVKGHRRFMTDRHYLRELVDRPAPVVPTSA